MTTTERIPDGPGVEPCVEHSLSGLYRGSTWARACIDRAPVPVGSACRQAPTMASILSCAMPCWHSTDFGVTSPRKVETGGTSSAEHSTPITDGPSTSSADCTAARKPSTSSTSTEGSSGNIAARPAPSRLGANVL